MIENLLLGKYHCIGKVLRTGVKKDVDAPPIWYDKNNSTGYLTGQWIDVEVIETTSVPAKYSGTLFTTGQVIEGFWAYGGDNGIAGNPQKGDRVGYFEGNYAHVWEKIPTGDEKLDSDHEKDTELESLHVFSILGIFVICSILLGTASILLLIVSKFNIPLPLNLPLLSLSTPAFFVFLTSAFIFLLSSFAIIYRSEWGITGYITACLAFFIGAVYFLNVSTSTGVSILTLPIFLLILESIDERGGALKIHLAHYIRKGLSAESQIPAKALRYFEVLERRNKDTSPIILLLLTILMPTAYVLAFIASANITKHQGLISGLIISFVGLAPALHLVYKKKIHKKTPYESNRTPISPSFLVTLLMSILMMLVLFFGDSLILVGIIIVSFLIMYLGSAPFFFALGQAENPSWEKLSLALQSPAGYTVFTFIFILIFLYFYAGVRFNPFSLKRIIKDISIGVRENSQSIFSFITNIFCIYLFSGLISTEYEFLYTNLETGIILYAFSGATFAWEACREDSSYSLKSINTIARARCLARLGKRQYGEYILYSMLQELNEISVYPEFLKYMAEAQREMLLADPNMYTVWENLEMAESSIPELMDQKDVYIKSIDRIRGFASGS